MHEVWILLVGMFISFLGQLPLGSMNMAATQLSLEEGYKNAWKYGLGIALVEIVYLRMALIGMKWVVQHQRFFELMSWITVVLFLLLSVLSFRAAQKKDVQERKLPLFNNKIHRFLLGATVSAINPAQIPFWFIWSTYLINNNILHTTAPDYNFFTIGVFVGTLSGIAVYIYGGNYAVVKLKASKRSMIILLGFIFLISALIQLFKLIFEN